MENFNLLYSLYVFVSASAVIGSLTALVIQIGKLYLPSAFGNNTAQNWRLAIVFIVTGAIFVTKLLGYGVDLSVAEQLIKDITDLGYVIFPALVLLSDLFAKYTYMYALKGVSFIGKSWTKK